MTRSDPPEVGFDPVTLAERATELRDRTGRRVLLGIAGPPGAGKSTISSALLATLGASAVVVPMDGFHYSNSVLRSLRRESRKGAPDTFDVAGYVALLDRLRDPASGTVYGPSFHRAIEEPIANDIPVHDSVDIVITEGNYLLTTAYGWHAVRPRLDQVWYVEVDPDVRRRRLTARHAASGKDEAHAIEWTNGPDETNALLVARSRPEADLIVRLT